MKRPGLIVILVLLAGGGALVTLGKMDQKTDLSAVLEMWGDALRDTDEVTLQATRVSTRKEVLFGQEMRLRLPPDDPTWTPYVDAVGQTLVPHVRRTGISYHFHAIDSFEVNAFALPGGEVFIFTGMLRFLNSEAELAAILGHEISHVDLRHCIEKYQYELAARKVGLDGIGQLADRARLPVTIAYRKNEEIEADAQGARLSVQAGYDPGVAPVLFSRMQAAFEGPPPDRAATPQGELLGTLARGLIDYFHSHPSSRDRMVRLDDLIVNNRGSLKGKTVYVGVSNYRQRIPRTQQDDPSERRVF
jgi:predicted Zn-dependent protease